MPNRLIEKIRAYLKNNDLDKLKDNYIDMAADDDFIDYEPLTQKMVDDSNKELDQALQYKINKKGF
mgnify:FL=1